MRQDERDGFERVGEAMDEILNDTSARDAAAREAARQKNPEREAALAEYLLNANAWNGEVGFRVGWEARGASTEAPASQDLREDSSTVEQPILNRQTGSVDGRERQRRAFDSPSSPQGGVSDEMVEAAIEAYGTLCLCGDDSYPHSIPMRRALTAAFAASQGEAGELARLRAMEARAKAYHGRFEAMVEKRARYTGFEETVELTAAILYNILNGPSPEAREVKP